ncbi:MAG: hypothetical protein J6A07_03685, partial [Firmicutes bacterium]|nr:hypothetical protein [Bacillota bacterium]
MKRILPLILAAGLSLLGLVGCGSSNAETASDVSSQTEVSVPAETAKSGAVLRIAAQPYPL